MKGEEIDQLTNKKSTNLNDENKNKIQLQIIDYNL